LIVALLAVAVPAYAGEIIGKVVAVQDGDTLTVLVGRKQVRVRLSDIDAPERKQPFGTRSRQSLSEICGGKAAQVDDRGKDRYGRTLGAVRCAGVDANAEQVRGAAWRGYMCDTRRRIRRCTRCNRKRRILGGDCGRTQGQCRRGSGDSNRVTKDCGNDN
jgi:endonuclease YncB( thermonuclease family)